MVTSSSQKSTCKNSLILLGEFCACLFVFFMFSDKGESFRDLGLYGGLLALIFLAMVFRTIRLKPDRVQISFYAFIAAIAITTFFSLRPAYSFQELSDDILSGLIIFTVISYLFTTRMVSRMGMLFCLIGIVLLGLGLYSYLTGATHELTSQNSVLTAHKNRYALFLAYVFPFFLFYFFSSAGLARIAWGAMLIAFGIAMFFTASRGGIINVVAVSTIWGAAYFTKIPKKTVLKIAAACIFIVVLSLAVLPEQPKKHLMRTTDLINLNNRVRPIWVPALSAVSKRPLVGWGYGGEIVHSSVPYEGGPQLPTWLEAGGHHNTFISILFQNGLIGLTAYMALLISTTSSLLQIIKRETGEPLILAIALLSVVFGSFLVHALVKLTAFRFFAVIAGLSSALWRDLHTTKEPAASVFPE